MKQDITITTVYKLSVQRNEDGAFEAVPLARPRLVIRYLSEPLSSAEAADVLRKVAARMRADADSIASNNAVSSDWGVIGDSNHGVVGALEVPSERCIDPQTPRGTSDDFEPSRAHHILNELEAEGRFRVVSFPPPSERSVIWYNQKPITGVRVQGTALFVEHAPDGAPDPPYPLFIPSADVLRDYLEVHVDKEDRAPEPKPYTYFKQVQPNEDPTFVRWSTYIEEAGCSIECEVTRSPSGYWVGEVQVPREALPDATDPHDFSYLADVPAGCVRQHGNYLHLGVQLFSGTSQRNHPLCGDRDFAVKATRAVEWRLIQAIQAYKGGS